MSFQKILSDASDFSCSISLELILVVKFPIGIFFNINVYTEDEYTEIDTVFFEGFVDSTGPETFCCYVELDITVDGTYYLVFSNGIDGYVIKLIIGEHNESVVSVNNLVKEDINLNVYPNPVRDIATITYTSSVSTPVELYTLSGQLLYTETNTFAGSNEIKLNMSDYSNGTYLVKVGTTTTRIVK